MPASRSSSCTISSFAGDSRATLTGGALVFGSAFLYALYLVDAGAVIARLGSLRFIAWAMLVSCVFVLAHFALTRDVALLRVPASIYALSLAMAVFSTVLPTWLIAEAIHRLGASTSSLIGSLGPVFTIGLGALILGEAVQGIQLFGAALVLVGVMLVTLQPARTKRDAADARRRSAGYLKQRRRNGRRTIAGVAAERRDVASDRAACASTGDSHACPTTRSTRGPRSASRTPRSFPNAATSTAAGPMRSRARR